VRCRGSVSQENEVAPVGEKDRPVTGVFARPELRRGRDGAAALGYPVDDVVLIPREENDPVLAPGSPAGAWSVGQDLRRPSRSVYALQLPFREESDRRAVGRPEKLHRVVGSRESGSLKRAERADPDRALTIGGVGDERDPAAVRRESRVIEGLERRSGGHLERKPHRVGVGSRPPPEDRESRHGGNKKGSREDPAEPFR